MRERRGSSDIGPLKHHLWIGAVTEMRTKNLVDDLATVPLVPERSKYFSFCFIKKKLWTTHERQREMFYLTTHSTHFIYGYMA